MQSCWLPPSQRPSVAEIFLLLSSLLAAERGVARGMVGEEIDEDEEYDHSRGRRGESEESFERRWDLLRPPAFQRKERERDYGREDNSYPLLDPVGSRITPSSSELDDILTVTETSKGLNFEYFWEKAHARRGYKPLPPPQPIPTVNNNHRQSLDTPTVVPVISARSPSLASEYYIRLEEHTPQDKSPTLKGRGSFRSESMMCAGDMELVEIRSGMLGKERVPYCSSDKCTGGKGIQTVRSSEVKLQVPNTGVAEFRDTSSRVTDFSVINLEDDEEEDDKRTTIHADTRSSKAAQAPVLPPKPRSMSMSSANHLHSRPLPAPPLGYRGLPHYTISGKIETDPHHMSSCPPSSYDHLGLHRPRQTLPPSPSLSPSLPPSSHPIYPPPQTCPPPLPPHSKPQRICPGYGGADTYSRYSKLQTQRSDRDPLSCDVSDRTSASRHDSKDAHPRVKDFDSPVRRENPLRPIYRNLPRTQPPVGRQSSSSPTYSDEDDSPYTSPVKPCGGTTVTHSSLSEDADPAAAELFSRGMKRTQSRLDTILPAIWKEDAELQAERVAAAKKSPMHLFLTEISTGTEASESKSDASWGEKEAEKGDEERWRNLVLPNRGMRRSQSLVTELGSAAQSGVAEKHTNMPGPEANSTATKESFQSDLFLTEIDTGRTDTDQEAGSQNDPVKYLYPAGSRLRPYVCAPGLPSYTEAEEAYSKGMRRSRSLLSEITVGKRESDQQPAEKDKQRAEMTREEFLKEIQSAETFLTEIISRQNANKKEGDTSYSPTPLSPEYESICIDPSSAQTIRFESESSIRASNKGKDETQTEAIYAQVTKRAKKSELKVSTRPEIPILHITSSKAPVQPVHLCPSGEFVFAEITPKNGLLHNQTLVCPKEDEECSEGPALPARGEQMDRDPSAVEPAEDVEESHTVKLRENKSSSESQKASFIGNGDIMREAREAVSPERGAPKWNAGDSQKETHRESARITAPEGSASRDDNGVFAGAKNSHENNSGQERHCPVGAATPTTPDWDPSSDVSLVTPTDSVLSPMTSSSADCLTPSDSWQGGGAGSGGWRALGSETPHRDSAYFSDSDWEGDGMNRRSSDGLVSSRPSSSRASDRGTLLTGIEEKTETEEEVETEGKSLHKSSKVETEVCEEGMIPLEKSPENPICHSEDDKEIQSKGLDPAQRDDSGIFTCESKKSSLQFDGSTTEDCVAFIDKLFSKLEDEPLKGIPDTGGFAKDNHYTDGIISQITDCKFQNSAETDSHLRSKSLAGANTVIAGGDCILEPHISGTKMGNHISALNAQHCRNAGTPLRDENECRLSKLYGVQIAECEETPSTDGSKDRLLADNEVSVRLIRPSWAEKGAEELGPGLDHNELGLRNLHLSDSSEDARAEMETAREKQLAAAELSNSAKEKSPLREPSGTVNSCGGLGPTADGLWGSEERRGHDVVRGEIDCHRQSQSRDLHLWPDENDQWASPQKRCEDVDLTSEFFSGFNNKAWEVGERLVVGQEFWETEGNDELAGSEPHPAVLEACEETWNDETQGLRGGVVTETWVCKDAGSRQTAQVAHVQQEENVEEPGETDSFNPEVSDVEVENVEIPDEETSELRKEQISSSTETVGSREPSLKSPEPEENHNLNGRPPNRLSGTQSSAVDTERAVEKCVHQTPAINSANISILITDELGNAESGLEPETQMSQWVVRHHMEDGVTNVEEEYGDTSPPSNPLSCPGDLGEQEEIDKTTPPSVDNFSSVDFPSPPASVDLDVQDDKLESLDDSFPSPPPSLTEAEDFVGHMSLEEFISEAAEAAESGDSSDAPLTTTPSEEVSASLKPSCVHRTVDEGSEVTSAPPPAHGPLNTLPELLISEWKDLDEEPLEDFEKLEQLCCISGDEEDLFLGNLELLESLKKAPDQWDITSSDTAEGMGGSSTPPEDDSDDSDKVLEETPHVIPSSRDQLEERSDGLRPPNQTSDVKDQSCLSKMTTKNGLMMQVNT